MTDQIDPILQDIADAIAHFKLTTVGFLSAKKGTGCYHTWKTPPAGTHWSDGFLSLDAATIKLEELKPPPPPVAAGVFVSPTGSDTSGDGSQMKPYATLSRARTVMRLGALPPVCYLRGGTYSLFADETISGTTYGLRLTSIDSGQTYEAFQDEKPILDCSAVHNGLIIDGASDVTFDGLEVFGFKWAGLGVHGGNPFFQVYPGPDQPTAKNNTIRNCISRNGSTDTSVIFGYGAAPIYCIGDIPGTTIENNAVHDCPTGGIKAQAGDIHTHHGNITGLLIHGNAVTDTCQKVTDAGGIYLQDVYAASTDIRIFDNFVRDCAGARCIYLDDGVSNADIAGNIMAGVFDLATSVHGGRMNKWHHNLIDAYALTSQNGPVSFYFQGSNNPVTDHAGVEFTNNIVVARGKVHAWIGYPVACRDNLYWGYKGGTILTAPDTNPVKADPLLSGPLYTIAANSPAFAAPVSFRPLPTHWGPPGYVIPAGTPPSYA